MWLLRFQFSLHLSAEKLDLWLGLWLGGKRKGPRIQSLWGGSPSPTELPATLRATSERGEKTRPPQSRLAAR